MRLPHWLTGYKTRSDKAEAAYFAAQDVASYLIWDLLADEADPAERARLLRAVAGCEYAMGVTHTPAFGPDPNPDEDGREVAESDRMAAQLRYLLANIEDCVAIGGVLFSLRDGEVLGARAWEVAEQMSTTLDLRARHALLADLYEAVEPIVGGQAAECLACIPAPGCPPLRPYVPPAQRATATA